MPVSFPRKGKMKLSAKDMIFASHYKNLSKPVLPYELYRVIPTQKELDEITKTPNHVVAAMSKSGDFMENFLNELTPKPKE